MKLPFDFGIKLVFRLLAPGLFLTLALLPAVNAVLEFGGWQAQTEYVFVLVVIFAGWLVVVSDMPLYMLFEGRAYWPDRLWRLCVAHEAKRVRDLEAKLSEYEKEASGESLPDAHRKRAERNVVETYVKLRSYPLARDGEGETRGPRANYVSRLPTRLGNILEAYEENPDRLYGMPSVFYWWRVWMTLDKDLREEIDGQQAMADSTVYISFAFFFNGLAWAFYGVLLGLNNLALRSESLRLPPQRATLFTHLPPWWVIPLLSAASFLLCFIVYRISLHLHAQFGEVYKSVFDMRRANVKPDEVVAGTRLAAQPYFATLTPAQKYWAVWNYLQYNLVECPRCGVFVSADKLKDACELHGDPAA
jgi:hypothetical protein